MVEDKIVDVDVKRESPWEDDYVHEHESGYVRRIPARNTPQNTAVLDLQDVA